MAATFTISDAVADVLKQATMDQETVTLNGQLDRKLYQDVNKVLEAYGGKWNRGRKCHTFPSDPRDILKEALERGKAINQQQTFQVFLTPIDVAHAMIFRAGEAATLQGRVLEPSAGDGNIAIIAGMGGTHVTCVEIRPEACAKLRRSSHVARVFERDFLTVTPEEIGTFKAVLMNPPFTKNADIRHILHAWNFLEAGGRLVAIASPHFTFAEDKVSVSFRDFVARHGSYEELPEGTFQESGTGIRTVMITMTKPKASSFNALRDSFIKR